MSPRKTRKDKQIAIWIGLLSSIATIFSVVWMVFTYYKPNNDYLLEEIKKTITIKTEQTLAYLEEIQRLKVEIYSLTKQKDELIQKNEVLAKEKEEQQNKLIQEIKTRDKKIEDLEDQNRKLQKEIEKLRKEFDEQKKIVP